VPLGQLAGTKLVENFPGFPEGVSGIDLMNAMEAQAKRFGARVVYDNIERLDVSARPFRFINSASGLGESDAVIVATGAKPKLLPLPGIERFLNNGVYTCAVCDGPLPRNDAKAVVVVGGGDAACEYALLLARFARVVHLVHRRGEFKAAPINQERVRSHPRIKLHLNEEVNDVVGDPEGAGVTGVRLRSGEFIDAVSIFLAVGHEPNTQFLKGQVALDQYGLIKLADPLATETSVGRARVACTRLRSRADRGLVF
jgi:thioredoxin reductase (NADPH)